MQQNTLVTEISMLILAVLLIVAGSFLLYVGKIGYDAAIFFFISALGLFGFNGALKAPSAQQSQLAAAKQPAGINPTVVANFQTARAIQAHQITQAASALETALVQPIQ